MRRPRSTRPFRPPATSTTDLDVVDFVGIALVVTASGTFLTAAISGYIAIKQNETHKLVNGMSHELTVANQQVAFNEGEKAGIAGERGAPMAPVVIEPVVMQPAPKEPT